MSETAHRLHVSEADLASAAVRDLVARQSVDFQTAADLVLKKNQELHLRLIEQSGGMPGLRDLGLLESSLAQPHKSFGGVDLYPGLNAKAAVLGFSLI